MGSAESQFMSRERITVEQVQDSEILKLGELVEKFWIQLNRPLPPQGQIVESLTKLFDSPDCTFLVAKNLMGALIGYTQVRFHYSLWYSGETAVIEDLFVVPENRRVGAGRMLTEAAISLASVRNCGAVSLDTNSSNIGAVALYESLRFVSGSSKWPDQNQLYFRLALK